MEGESGVRGSIIVKIHSSDIQEYQTSGETCVFRSIIDELHY